MRSFRFQPRHLILLALFQLVAGPLVLLQVSVFCSLTVREAPTQGVAKAMVKAWNHEAFQSLLVASDNRKVSNENSLPGTSKDGLVKAKMHLIDWTSELALSSPPIKLANWLAYHEAWTPAWPQAPPGTPPRVG